MAKLGRPKKTRFKAAEGSPINDKQAQSYGTRIVELMQELGKETLSPADIVKDAKQPTVAYHDFFEWDDKRASDLYRLRQAGSMTRSIVEVVITREDKAPTKMRAFFNVQDGKQKGYAKREYVFSHADTREQVLGRAFQEARSWADRYETYTELSAIVKVIKTEVKKHACTADSVILSSYKGKKKGKKK
jgi:hypothetical protein